MDTWRASACRRRRHRPTIIGLALDGRQFDSLLTDPPYGVKYEPGQQQGEFSNARKNKNRPKSEITNDNLDAATYEEFLTSVFAEAIKNAKPGAPAYIFHAGNTSAPMFNAFTNGGWHLAQQLIWAKHQLVLSRQDYHWRHEPIIYGWKPGAAHQWNSDRKQTTILEFDRPAASPQHPTMKPVDLLTYLIENSSHPGDLIFDPFGGSGSTLIAAHQTGRQCVTIELDPTYADVIAHRWAQHTGQPALRNGKPQNLK
jgi:DNA modification methylase